MSTKNEDPTKVYHGRVQSRHKKLLLLSSSIFFLIIGLPVTVGNWHPIFLTVSIPGIKLPISPKNEGTDGPGVFSNTAAPRNDFTADQWSLQKSIWMRGTCHACLPCPVFFQPVVATAKTSAFSQNKGFIDQNDPI